MTAQRSDQPVQFPGSQLDSAAERRVVRRAVQLCLRAEPHTDEPPCAAHVTEANRQLVGLAV